MFIDLQNFPRFDIYDAEQNAAPSNVFQPPPEYQSVANQSKKPAHVESDELPPSYSKATAPTSRPTEVDTSVQI